MNAVVENKRVARNARFRKTRHEKGWVDFVVWLTPEQAETLKEAARPGESKMATILRMAGMAQDETNSTDKETQHVQ
jgi:hypothetical protein